MEDRLIFRYHLDRANPKPELLREPSSSLEEGYRPARQSGSEGGTQEGRSTGRWLYPG